MDKEDQKTFNPFPVVVYDGSKPPAEGTYYLVAGNGTWLHKDTGIVRCFVKIENIATLPDLVAADTAECRLPKLPARHTRHVKEFFKKVVELHTAESAVVLYFNKTTGDYKIYVPEQHVGHGGVHYTRVGLTHADNYLPVGTIHSHCDFEAFHSGTDIDDERHFDGLHVTFGHNDRDAFTITACVAVNGTRTAIDPTTAIDGITPSGNKYFELTPPDDDPAWPEELDTWLAHVKPYSQAAWDFWPSLQSGWKESRKVDWADENDPCKTYFGPGPFMVVGEKDGKIEFSAMNCRASLPASKFKEWNK